MGRLEEIYASWENYIFKTPEIEFLVKERMAICVKCDALDEFNICTQCYCPSQGKAMNPHSNCTLGKWNNLKLKENMENKIETPTPKVIEKKVVETPAPIEKAEVVIFNVIPELHLDVRQS